MINWDRDSIRSIRLEALLRYRRLAWILNNDYLYKQLSSF